MSLFPQSNNVALEQAGTAVSWSRHKITSTAVFGLRKKETSDRQSKWPIPHPNLNMCETERSLRLFTNPEDHANKSQSQTRRGERQVWLKYVNYDRENIPDYTDCRCHMMQSYFI